LGRPCGCSSALIIKAGCGVIITGTGEPDDPMVISVDPCALAGDGLRGQGDGCKLAVSGGAPPPGGSPASITKLAERAPCQNIIGAYLGGYLYRPQSTRDSLKYAAERGYDLVHLPVRFLADGTPVITPDPMMGRQNGNVPNTQVQHQTPAQWRARPNDAGEPGNVLGGWFGYLAPVEQGLVTLSEALDLLNNRVPAVLELMWPITPDPAGKPVWTQDQEPPPERVDAFIRGVKQAVEGHGAQENVIVTTQFPKIPGPNGERDVFKELDLPHNGPALYDVPDADRNPPEQGPWKEAKAARPKPEGC
jgi:hypothetical protein